MTSTSARSRFTSPGEVVGTVPGAGRIHHGELQVGAQEGKIVVPAVPDDHFPFLLRGQQHTGVIHAGKGRHPGRQVRLVLLPLLEGAAPPGQVVEAPEALHGLHLQVTIGRRVAYNDRPEPRLAQQPADRPEKPLLPQPVRTAQTASTCRLLLSMLASGPISRKSAPDARIREARCMRLSWETSE